MKLEKPEFKIVLDEMGLNISNYQVETLINQIDLDSTGEIRLEDFLKLISFYKVLISITLLLLLNYY